MKPKAYHNFQDKYGNNYQFNDYMTFATWWYNLKYKDQIQFPDRKALQHAAANSGEARTPYMSPSSYTFEQFIRTVQQNTDRNAHSENMVFIASYYKYEDLASAFKDVLLDHLHDRCMTRENKERRDDLYALLMHRIESDHPTQYHEVYKSL